MDVGFHQEALSRRDRGVALLQAGNIRRLPALRVAVLSTFNVELMTPFLMEALERIGYYGTCYLGAFGQVAQEIINPQSGLYEAVPEAVVIVPAVEDVLAPLFTRPGQFSPKDVDALLRERGEELERWVDVVLERLPGATCYVVVFGTERAPMEYVLDPRSSVNGQRTVEQWLQAVRKIWARDQRVVVVDWDWHARRMGLSAYQDERLWYLGRMRLNPAGLATLSEILAEHVAASRGLARKVAVLDLDNTLWGEVVGEVGLRGLVLGEEGLGLAFQDFQRELLKLHDVGILLAICSKNNPDDVWEVFDRHPGMVLRREHVTATRINWQDKVRNLLELSEELGLGTDSFVVLDDNPVERGWVRTALPDVLVPELPDDVAYRPTFLRRLSCFRRTALTESDTRRTQDYRAQGVRRQLQAQAASLDDFLASLEQAVSIEAIHEGSIARAAQLAQRTNQFNLTTRRYTVAELERMQQDPLVEVYTLAIKDRFGDSGITGLSILRFDAECAEIDTLLLSCRILGRRVERVFLAFLVERARAYGARYLVGRFLPTKKNGQTASFYPDHGFAPIGEGVFRFDLARQQLAAPAHIAVTVPGPSTVSAGLHDA